MAQGRKKSQMREKNSFDRRALTNAAIKLAALILFALLGPILLSAGSVNADTISNPDSDCTTSNIHVNRNLVNTGDMLVTGQYKLPYASPPSIGADKTFLFELVDTDGTTVLGYNAPYVYFDNGYNDGIFSLYFDSGHTPTWGVSYIVRIAENPTQFDTPQHWDFVIPSNAYSVLTDQNGNQADLTGQCITMAQNLQAIYNISGGLVTTSNGTVLTTVGEDYFRGAISSLQAMAPKLFLVQNLPVDLTSTNWTTTQFDTYENRWNGTWVGTDINATSTQWGMTPGLVMSMMFTAPLCLGAVVFSSIKFRKTDPGFVTLALFLIMAVIMGFVPKAIFASVYQLLGIYVAYLLFFK